MTKSIINLFLTGIVFGAGPCMASCGPLLISYIVGTKKDMVKGLLTYCLFSLSRIFAYLVIALSIFFLGSFVLTRIAEEYSWYIFILGGVFVIFVGVIVVLGKHLAFGFLKKVEQIILERDVKSVILFGLIIGFLPCAPLIAIFSYIGLISKSWLSSLLYSFSFGLGTSLSPLILLVALAGIIPKFFNPRTAIYYRIFNMICGLIIIFLGIQLISRAF